MGPRIRTGFSFRTAAGTIEEVIARLKECEYEYAPITDRASTFGFVEWGKAAKKAGLKPVYGLELAVSPDPEAKKPRTDYWTFIATDSVQPLHELLLTATQQFRYEPLLTYPQALAATGLHRIAGRRAVLSLMPHPLPRLWVAASPSANPALLRQAVAAGHPLVACGDNFYPAPGDDTFYQVLVGRNASVQTWAQHILTPEEWHSAMSARGFDLRTRHAAVANGKTIMAEQTAVMRRGKMLSPPKPLTLRQMCVAGAADLGISLEGEYGRRLDEELQIIKEKNFEDYFYIVGDLVSWARERMVVGPARGSSAGSLVCYLLKITAIDPIKYDLLFYRFISIDRTDWPDIDIDFNDQKRDLVFQYLKDKYGSDHVARLGTVAMYKADSAMKETAGAMNIPPWETRATLDAIIKRSGGDARQTVALAEALDNTEPGKALLHKYPEIAIAKRLEGHPRHYGQHAAGVILTDLPITEYIGIDARTNGTHCNKKDAEAMDILKIDALGLTQLGVMEDCLRLMDKDHRFTEQIPLDDPAAFQILNDRKFAGVFQFQGSAFRQLAHTFQFTDIEDLIALTALARPGPLGSGEAFRWVKRKNGNEPVTVPHPIFAPYTRKTFGVFVYQEQIMEVCRIVGDLTWEQVTQVRRSMGKNLGKEFFDQFGEGFKQGAAKKGIPRDVLDRVWEGMCNYGNNAFNRSHAVAYGIVSYWCAWFKAHYPLEFAAATLQAEQDPNRMIGFLRELNDEGIGYVPVHPELSEDRWSIHYIDNERKIVGPITLIKGIGPKVCQSFMSAKRRGEPMPDKVRKLLQNPVTPIDSLWPIRDAIKRVLPDPTARNIYTKPETVAQILSGPLDRDVLLLATPTKINKKDENEALNVGKRGYVLTDGLTNSLNVQWVDDTGVIFGKINRFDYAKMGVEVAERGRPFKALYAVKARVWGTEDFIGLSVKGIRYIGDSEKDLTPEVIALVQNQNVIIEGEAENV